jgi:predicted metal-dependent hydrolase
VLKRLKYWQIKMGLTKYKIDLHFNWNRRVLGSCRYPNNNCVTINFTNRIFAYSKKQMDCIIVHELSHIIHFNHKKEFWNHVKKHLPDYDKLHKEIKWT